MNKDVRNIALALLTGLVAGWFLARGGLGRRPGVGVGVAERLEERAGRRGHERGVAAQRHELGRRASRRSQVIGGMRTAPRGPGAHRYAVHRWRREALSAP